MENINSLLDFTGQQFKEVTQAFSDRTAAGDKILEATFQALAVLPEFNERFYDIAARTGLDVTSPIVQQSIRAMAISFFLYGEALGRIEAPRVVN